MRKTIGKIVIPTLILLLLFGTVMLWYFARPAEARKVYGKTEAMIGTYTGAGSGQTHNIKASLDLAHTDLDAMLINDTELLGLLGASTGSIYYVDSAITTGNTGLTWATAMKTIDTAVNLCTADAGDIILVAAGHAENLGTTDPDFDDAGITIYGLGEGEQRPVLSYDASTDIFTVDADDIAIYNLIFLAHDPDIAKGIDIVDGAENTVIKNCSFMVHTEGTDEFLIAINIGAGCDNIIIEDNHFEMGGGNATEAILFDAESDYSRVVNNTFFGDYSTACIFDDTTACVGILIEDNVFYNGDITIDLNTEPCIELKSDTTGLIINNICACNVATPDLAIVAADCHLFGNTYSENESTAGSVPIGVNASEDPYFNRGNYFIVEPGAFDTSGTWSTVASHEVVTVTGAVRIRMLVQCTTTLTDGADGATLTLGTAGNAAAWIASTSAGGSGASNQLDATEVWIDATPADLETASYATAILDFVVVGGLDVGYTIGGEALSGGVLVFHVWWEPLDSTGLCSAHATGGSL